MRVKQSIQKSFLCFIIMGMACVFILSSVHADAQSETSDLLIKVSLPNIANLEPWIEKSKEERIRVLPNYEEVKAEVRKTYINAYASKDFVFMAASALSGALTYWMKDDDAGVCSMLDESADYLSQTSAGSAMFLVVVKTAKVEEIYARLYAAAGCGKKDKPYWSRKVVSSFNTMAAYLTPGPNHTLDNASIATQEHFGTCLNSDKIAGDTSHGQSIVSDASIRGCYAISLLANNELNEACGMVMEALTFIDQHQPLVVTDPDELKAQHNLEKMSTDLNCRNRLTEAEEQMKNK